MSEYQYYEFRAIDRPLTDEEIDELGQVSTRAEITSTSFTNTYNYGSFRGDAKKLMERYFDAFVYVANWGTRRLMLRIPSDYLDVHAASEYCAEDTFEVQTSKRHVILDFTSVEEGGGEWTQGEPWMASLIGIRTELMRGDYRSLYLGWLSSIQHLDPEEMDDDDNPLEPPVPPGLANLSGSLRELVSFLRIDDELIAAAAAGNTGEAPARPTRQDLAKWIKGLPAEDKNEYLLKFIAEDGDVRLRAEMVKQFRDDTAPMKAKPSSDSKRRTVSQLIAARDALLAESMRSKSEKAAAERLLKEQQATAARAKHLDDLASREPAAWKQVETLIATMQPKSYDAAVALLVDLRELAARSRRTSEVMSRIQEVRLRHKGKSSLMARFRKAGLGG